MFEKDSYYSVNKITDITEVKQRINPGADTLNWLFLSTSGVHGSYTTLEDLQRHWGTYEDGEPRESHYLTVLVVQPRTVRVWYGEIEIEREDIPWLAEQVKRTLAGVAESQEGNLPNQCAWT